MIAPVPDAAYMFQVHFNAKPTSFELLVIQVELG